MPIAYSELHDNGGVEYVAQSPAIKGQSSVRRFKSPGYSAEAAVISAIAQSNGELQVGARHPRENSLRLDSIAAVERLGSGDDAGWIVEARYVRLDAPRIDFPPNRSDPDFSTTEMSFGQIEIDMPIISSWWIVEPVTTQERIMYQGSTVKIIRPSIRMNFQVNVPSFSPYDAATISAQTSSIHVIAQYGQAKWLFLGGSVTQTGQSLWRVDYSWMAEPGNPSPTLPTFGGQISLVSVPARQPHQKYVVGYGGGPGAAAQPRPIVEVLQPYVEQASGYLTLPGRPFQTTIFQP